MGNLTMKPTSWRTHIQSTRLWSLAFVVLLPMTIDAQKESTAFGSAGIGNAGDMSSNIQKFQELYGIATQLVNLGGNILNNAGGGPQHNPSAIRSYHRGGNDGGNGILGEIARPQLRGIPVVESSSYDGAVRNEAKSSEGMLGNLFSGYGGGPLGTGSRSQQKSILDMLMGTFLGSSFASSGTSQPNFFSPSIEESTRFGNAKQGSNIEALVGALSRSGAKRADFDSEDGGGPTSLLSQFFGGGKK